MKLSFLPSYRINSLFLCLSFIVLSLFSFTNNVYAALDPGDFRYKRPVTIQELSGGNLNNYQVLLNIDTSSLIGAGKMQSDCDDVRFADSSYNELNYWIETGTCNTTNTKIWIKIPTLSSSSISYIDMYYGNSIIGGASNASTVFDSFLDNWRYQITSSCTGVSGWKDYTFNDYSWNTFNAGADIFPNVANTDFYMRKRVMIVGSVGTSTIKITSDDGRWVYVNNSSAYNDGCSSCHCSGTSAATHNITSDLNIGENIIAIHCTNGPLSATCFINSGGTSIPNSYSRKYASVDPSVSLGAEIALPFCGDGVINGTDVCDGSAGCSASEVCKSDCSGCECASSCTIEGYSCGTYTFCGVSTSCGTCTGAQICSGGTCVSSCGDGVINGTDVCDGSAGCSASEVCKSDCSGCECASSCTIEGYSCGTYTFCGVSTSCGTCTGAQICSGGTCIDPFCGDGFVTGTEVCDINSVSSCAAGETCEMGCGRCISGIIWNKRLVKDRVDELIDFLLTIASSLVFLIFLISGIMYAFSAGNSVVADKAKKLFISALIGIVLVLSSYAILFLMDQILTQ